MDIDKRRRKMKKYDQFDQFDIDSFIWGMVVISVILLTAMIISNVATPKFCPECGRRERAAVTHCPFDGVELKDRQSLG